MADGPIRIDGIDHLASDVRDRVRQAEDFGDYEDYFSSRIVALGFIVVLAGGGLWAASAI